MESASLHFAGRRLRERGEITSQQIDFARKTRSICYRAIHGKTVTQEEVLDVIDTAAVIAHEFLEWLSWGFDDNWKPMLKTHSP